MKYYQIKTTALRDREFCFLSDPPEGTAALTHRMAEGHAMGAEFPHLATARMSDKYGGIKLPSILGNTLSFLIVASPLREVVEKRLASTVEYLEFQLLDHKGRATGTSYVIVNPLGAIDVLDLARSDVEYASTGAILEINAYVLDAGKAAATPALFRIRESPETYVMHEQLAQALVDCQPTNLELVELEVCA